jgi:predicted nicotinamide N-methyase
MSAFSFNFFDEQNDRPSIPAEATLTDAAMSLANPHLILPSVAPSAAQEIANIARNSQQVQQVDIPGTHLSFYVRKVVRDSTDNSVVQVALQRDVLTGVYEGGFKVWECAIDLIQYLHTHGGNQPWTNATVIEAGCGVGLPAIYALQQNAHCVYLQDLNVEVLEKSTQPAVALNARSDDELVQWCGSGSGSGSNSSTTSDGGKVHYVAGDWDAWETCCSRERGSGSQCTGTGAGDAGVDIILSTDTLYAKPQIEKLTRLLHRLLRKAPPKSLTGTNLLPSPCAYIAAKRYYFGTDGGTFTFEQVLQTMPPVIDPASGIALLLRAKKVHSINDNASNIRDILQVTWERVKS